MPDFVDRSRRRFLAQAGVGLTAAALPGWSRAMDGMGGMRDMPKLAPNRASPNFNPDVEIELVCRPDSVPILSGRPTRVWRYVASLLKGPENSLAALPNSYLGSTMRFSKGQKIRIHLRSELPEPTITHWHGLHVPMLMDGHPSHVIDRGESFVYEFEMLNRASMNLYHPHPHEATASQVYHGLAGAILVNDEEERALELPSGEFEIPLVIQDRSFDEDNQLVYDGGGMHGHHMTAGFHGERILVNGRPDFQFDVASRAYRLRVLNASNARIYKLAWDDGTPITAIGVDGGLLEQPEQKPYVMLAPAERLDVWADFSGRPVGSKLVMRSLPFSGDSGMSHGMRGGRGCGRGMSMGGMRGGMGMDDGEPLGDAFPIFAARVTRAVSDSPNLPRRLSKIVRYQPSEIANPDDPRPISISDGHMSMTLNGRPYGHDDVLPSERIPVDTVQLMEIFHAHARGGRMAMMSGMGRGMGMMGRGMGMMGGGMGHGMGMSMLHPIHLHGQYFQVQSRRIDPAQADAYADIRDGFIDSGWKDTVLVAPGERVRIVKPFQHFKGRFMFHCHILEHEDMGMMREFSVE